MSVIARREGIKLQNYKGTWYVIDEKEYDGETLYLVESEVYGDERAAMVINNDLEVLFDEAWNGFDDYDEYLEEEDC